MKKTLTILVVTLIGIGATFACAEALLHISRAAFADPLALAVDAEVRAIVSRVHHLWFSTPDPTDPFMPPFQVFSNANSDDRERLQRIFDATRLPPSTAWQSYDFLQSDEKRAQTAYTVHSNALGFRGEEREREKTADTFRIIVLGSYQAFGHGVEDDETYPAALEKALQKKYPKKHIEVWNGGRHAGTAIVGLARMAFEIFDYEPDLIILDYGFMDALVVGDDVFPQAMHFPGAVRFLVRPLVYLFDHSVLFAGMWNTFYGERDSTAAIEDFKTTMGAMITRAHDRGIPVILVRQLNAAPRSAYASLISTSTLLVDVDDVFTAAAIAPVPPEEWHSEYYQATWLADLDPAIVDFARTLFRHYSLRLNLYQLNSNGQELVGDYLARTIEKMNLISEL